MPEAGSKGLETLLVWPNRPGKHPLALISHGASRDLKARKSLSAIYFLPTAMEFARRGFAVAVVLRRGYGHSGGNYPKYSGLCKGTSYTDTVYEDAKDLHAAINYLGTLPQFDMNHVLPVGVSAGGLAVIGLTAFFPSPGIVGAISFAGGRGSIADNNVCEPNKLIATFALMGTSSHIPMLWVYAANDHFFNPSLAAKFLKAFNDNGGQAEFIQAPAYGADGHSLFSNDGIAVWTPIVDNYLKQLSLPLFKTQLPLPPLANLPTPTQLSLEGKQAFLDYLKKPPHKAFAVSSAGAYGWMNGCYSEEEAQNIALETCKKYANDCSIYAIDDHLQGVSIIPPPQQLSADAKRVFLDYLKSPYHKAFAISSAGGYGWISGSSSDDEARNVALQKCYQYNKECFIYAVNEELIQVELMEPPEELSEQNKQAFFSYLKRPRYKAFAVSSSGAYGWYAGSSSSEEARKLALQSCKKYANDCYLYALDYGYYK